MTDTTKTDLRLRGAVLALSLCAPAAWAQADAQRAYQEGRAQFEAGDFEAARDLLATASTTDPRNPEVFLWLGRAHFELGELDAALGAWQTTLRLAPDEPYATRMLAALRGVATDVESQIRMIEVMLRERLPNAALRECNTLLNKRALSAAQRARVMRLLAEAHLGRGKVEDALAALRRLEAVDSDAAQAPETRLILGRAMLRGNRVVRGLEVLRQVQVDAPGTAAAADAELAILGFELGQAPTSDGIAALARWLENHGDHPRSGQASRTLVDAWLALAEGGSVPRPDVELEDSVRSALAAAQQVYEASDPREGLEMTGLLLKFVDRHYGKRGAFAAAADAVAELLRRPLSPVGRRRALGALARYRVELALRVLTKQADAGTLEVDGLPDVLQVAREALAAIGREFPAEPAWDDRAALAERVRGLAAKLAWPEPVVRPRAPSVWAVDIALTVVRSGTPKAAHRAVQTILQIVRDLAPKSGDAALTVHARLMAELPDTQGLWHEAVLLQVELLDRTAREIFDRRLKSGADAENAELSDAQRQLIAVLGRLVARWAPQAETARQKLGAHLQPWIAHGHFATAELAWTLLEPTLPVADRRHVQLTVVELWVEEAFRRHRRLQAVGLMVPRQLEPRLAQALGRLYSLQQGIADAPAFGAAVRAVQDGIVGHYRQLEYFDVAEQALSVRGDRDVPAANEYAELRLAGLRSELAARELAQLLARHDGVRQIEVTPAFRLALDAYLKFLGDHPGSALSATAIDGALHIAQVFEQHGGYGAAAVVLRDLAAAADGIPLAAQVDPGGSSVAERARLRRARALHAEARQHLTEQLGQRPPGAAVPDELGAEFAAAIAAYREFLTLHPRSALVGEALTGVMTIGLEHANVGAWQVAEKVYADLLAAGLSLSHPERLEFCRGLCKLGPSMAAHARQALAAVVVGQPPAPASGGPRGGKASEKALATAAATPMSVNVVRSIELERPLLAAEALTLSDARGEDVLRVIRQREASGAAQLAQLGDEGLQMIAAQDRQGQQQVVLSAAEVARLAASINAAYEVFIGILRSHPDTAVARQARGEVLVMAGFWRGLQRWEEAAGLAERFLEDQPDDAGLPQLRLQIARDYLSLAAAPVPGGDTKQAMLAVVTGRFDTARAALARIAEDFPRQRDLVRQAQWDIAQSWLTQARAVAAISATLARGQFVRASRELQRVTAEYHDHPNIGQVPEMLWSIAQELVGRGFLDEAILVLSDVTVRYPAHPRADQAQLQIAQIYHHQLRQPLLAAEAYLELNFARGGNDVQLQNAVFQVGLELQGQRRWVEALHILEVFVDSFPLHPNAGQTLSLLGSIHQTNEAWEDAIAAYGRVISDYGASEFVKSARWSIAECVINLSRWDDAIGAYREFIRSYPEDAQSGEAKGRIEILKDLARYQKVVDEEGQRKAFDAQFQIATIVRGRLANPVKGIMEFRRVTNRWPESHLADDALYEVGVTLLTLGDPERARRALLAVAADYPTSPVADDALYLVGKSYEDEAAAFASVTRAQSVERAKEVAQKAAYTMAQEGRRKLRSDRAGRIANLKAQGALAAAEREEASTAAFEGFFANANVSNFVQWADQEAASLTATQLADRQDKIDAALREAVAAYTTASRVAAGDKAGDALLRMAKIQDEQLKDADAAMATWLEIVRQFSGTAVAEDASWRIAQFHERAKDHAEAIEAYKAFLRNYRRSPKAGDAQIAIAENHEQLGQWVDAMDAYTNYINNFQNGSFVERAREQIRWIKTYRL